MLGDVVAFNSYALYVVMAFCAAAYDFVMLPRAQVSAGRINEVLNSDIAVREGKDDGRQTEEKAASHSTMCPSAIREPQKTVWNTSVSR